MTCLSAQDSTECYQNMSSNILLLIVKNLQPSLIGKTKHFYIKSA